MLERLRVQGLIEKVTRRYRYYLTEFGRQVVLMALKLREMVIIPEPACAQARDPCFSCQDLIDKVLRDVQLHYTQL